MDRTRRILDIISSAIILLMAVWIVWDSMASGLAFGKAPLFSPQAEKLYKDLSSEQANGFDAQCTLSEVFVYFDGQRFRFESEISKLYRLVGFLSIILILMIPRTLMASRGRDLPKKPEMAS